jgi:hypothetical protein
MSVELWVRAWTLTASVQSTMYFLTVATPRYITDSDTANSGNNFWRPFPVLHRSERGSPPRFPASAEGKIKDCVGA